MLISILVPFGLRVSEVVCRHQLEGIIDIGIPYNFDVTIIHSQTSTMQLVRDMLMIPNVDLYQNQWPWTICDDIASSLIWWDQNWYTVNSRFSDLFSYNFISIHIEMNQLTLFFIWSFMIGIPSRCIGTMTVETCSHISSDYSDSDLIVKLMSNMLADRVYSV